MEFSILIRMTFWDTIDLALLYTPVLSHLLGAGFLPLAWGGGTASSGRFGVAVFPAAEAVTGVVALLIRWGVVVFPLVGASTVVGSLSGGSCVRCWLWWCTRGEENIAGWKRMFLYSFIRALTFISFDDFSSLPLKTNLSASLLVKAFISVQ